MGYVTYFEGREPAPQQALRLAVHPREVIGVRALV